MDEKADIKLLILGDIIGKPGRKIVKNFLSQRKKEFDLIIANVENAAHGFGVSLSCLTELKEAGVQIFTGGNHTFDRKEIFDFIEKEPLLLRPANYPRGTPGSGYCLFKIHEQTTVAVINIMGTVFMQPLASPFMVADEIIALVEKDADIIIVDFHAEATAEKVAMGWYLNGKVAAVVGTHTHVQTADERILPDGTGYITDAGCCGPANGIIGMDREGAFRRFVQQLPARLEVASGPATLCGVELTVNQSTGKTTAIQRVKYAEVND